MASITFRSPAFRRAVAALGVASLALFAGAPSAGAETASVDKKSTIDTYDDWDGTSYLQPFGNPQTSTYGQVITIPDGKDSLKKFTFYIASLTGVGTLKYRAYVYAWDGTKATDEVFRSKKKEYEVVAGAPEAQPVKIKTKKTGVDAGEQYVLFLSISEQYEDNPVNVLSQWALNLTDVLPGGYTTYINDDGNEDLWTTAPWSTIPDFDMAFKATLK